MIIRTWRNGNPVTIIDTDEHIGTVDLIEKEGDTRYIRINFLQMRVQIIDDGCIRDEAEFEMRDWYHLVRHGFVKPYLKAKPKKKKPRASYTKCDESPDRKHHFVPDYEYDMTGKTINCEHCGQTRNQAKKKGTKS